MIFQRLGAVLAKQARFRLRADGSIIPVESGRAWSRPYLILPRDQVRFTTMPLPQGAARDDVVAAARNWVAGLGVYEEPGCIVGQVEDRRATVWFWDQAFIDEQIQKAGLQRLRIQPLPGDLLAPPGDGGELLAAEVGFEGRAWRDGALKLSRWWPGQPSPEEWEHFLRASRLPLSGRPEPLAPVYASGPYNGRDLLDDVLTRFSPMAWAAGIIVFLCAPVVFEGSKAVQLTLNVHSAQSQLARLEEPLGDYRALREAAITASRELERMAAFSDEAHPGIVLSAVADPILSAGLEIGRWRHQEGGITLEVSGEPSVELAELVSAIDASGVVYEAEIRRGPRGGYVVTAQLTEATRV